MKLRFLLFLSALLLVIEINAQTPMPVSVPSGTSLRLSCNGEQEAGSVSIGNYIGFAQSNDIDLTRMYLCADDRVPIIHNGDALLNGDPDMSTAAGVGYGFYNCQPSVGGEDLVTVATDLCFVNNPAPNEDFFVASDNDPNFNLMLINDGTLINNFNGGNPGAWFFAPITYDRLDVINGSNLAVYEDDPSNPGVEGPCVDVSTDEAFEVVYLTQFDISNFTSSLNAGVCTGEFTITGGLPEYEPGATYSIEINSRISAAVQGTLERNDYTHGDVVRFTVPYGGIYTIEIRDGKNCVKIFDVNLNCGNTGNLYMPMETRMPGESFCFPIQVEGFTDVQGLSFTVKFDPNILTYVSSTWLVSRDQTVSAINTTDADKGIIKVIWSTESPSGENFPGITDFIELCFIVSLDAEQGDMSPLNFDGEPVDIESYDTNLDDIGVNINNGKVNILETDDLTVNYATCGTSLNEDNGSIKLTIFNGTGPYTVNYSGPRTNIVNIPLGFHMITLNDLPPGAYTVIITDNSDGEMTQRLININIGSPARPSFDIDVTSPSCNGREDGALELTSIMVEGDYSIEWSNNVYNTPMITKLRPGRYDVSVTDENGCVAEDYRILNYIPIHVNADITNVSCSGGDDGVATATGIGGQPGTNAEYSYEWSTGQQDIGVPTSTVINLSEGVYYVTITDSKACSGIDSVRIGADSEINLENVVIQDILCNGDTNGSISGEVVSGTANSNIRISITGQNTGSNQNFNGSIFSFNNLNADIYDINIQDLNNPGCEIDTFLTVSEPEKLTVGIINLRDESCSGTDDGLIEIGIVGGTLAPGSDYTISWSNGENTSLNDNLASGDYSVTVVDDNGCRDSLTNISIDDPVRPEIIEIDSMSISCAGDCDGILTPLINLGTYPITEVNWTINATSTVTADTLRNACSGFYLVEIVDEGGCRDSLLFNLAEPAPIDTASVVITHPTCPGDEDGSIIVTPSGGTSPYRYRWQDASIGNNNDPSGLGAGIYSLSISDIKNCPSFDILIELEDPPAISLNFSQVTGVNCSGDCDGSAIAGASGGRTNGPFSYTWSNGVTGASNTTMCPGEHYVVADDGTCSDTFYLTIPGPEELIINIIDSIPPTCNGYTDGRLEVEASGGNAGYIYEWSNSIVGAQNNDIPAGIYTVTVTDGNGCEVTRIIELEEPDVLIADIDASQTNNESCFNTEDGRITVSVTGGNTGSYDYNWNPNVSSDNVATGLGNGYYYITVTDSKGCTDTTSYLLSTPEEITFNINEIEPILCFGESAVLSVSNITGGSGSDYSVYLNGELVQDYTMFNSAGGEITIRTEDGNGCGKDTTIVINTPEELRINLRNEYVIQLGDSVLLEPVLTNQRFPIDSISWTPEDILSCDTCFTTYASPTDDSEVTIWLIDENGCIAQTTTFIKVDNSKNVYIPNAFTPDGDGLNDIFKIYTRNDVQSIKYFRVFDRWGNRVYDNYNIPQDRIEAEGWDGYYRGQPAAIGVYTYAVSVEFRDGNIVNYSGTVTILSTY